LKVGQPLLCLYFFELRTNV